MSDTKPQLAHRFRGYFPVIIDVETAGFNANTDALLEIAAVTLHMDEEGMLHPDQTYHAHVTPFEGANLEPAALEFNGIDPNCALRGAIDEDEAMKELCKTIRKQQKAAECQRSVIVAHNATFDQSFVNAAIERCNIKRTPFHPFVSFDTTTLSGLAVGQTVLVKACQAAGIAFDQKEAHSALYDAQKTAELFCYIVNRYASLGGWPLP
ncbi:MAG: ribonuclease T [Aestuariibacter sp.]|jgi:ribonuclease T|uniref:ribonuclease T n=1 Tax=Marisediminitalea TaxID=2662254 RepID=UPI0012A09E8C|nr:ribonuclease T [Marisediminitalea aggregata]MCP3863794.1 ribonuclease T [Aestuariibacter sp.]MEC7471245.1 ribonuclease T [Pseudomonadota bacterium]BBO28502.1 ribonuclease T [Alteromonas sp. I4]MCP4528139.1 ribonuclease T [Aestuariibacter sp.]MCP4946169.1 ribonuclease T [Aestuariibacter sp.]|tara:strand:- start:727 stop:1353 length:627 start_codon:yes stop_codon:yes gene_type:complete